MADLRTQIDEHRRDASNQQQQIDYAATKEDALGFALGAAEQYLLALEFASGAEKRELRSQAKAVMDRAEEIKRCHAWNPAPLIDFSNDNDEAEQAAGTLSEGKASLDLLLPSQATAPVTPTITSHSGVAYNGREAARPNNSPCGLLIDLSPEADQPAKSACPLLAKPPRRIAQLKVPVSTRKRTTKESIILLKASAVHGFKFPPWEDNPTSADFEQPAGTGKFKDVRDLTLSITQRDMFKCWARPDEALPPPLLTPDGGDGLQPLMQADHPVDLVQDAVTDCSVVASLCAASSRTEDGYGQMLSTIIWPQNGDGEPTISPNGKYVVRLQFNGCWRKIVIDDRLPIAKNGRLLHVVDRKNPSLLWPALLEKAYLKIHGGYDFPGSSSCSDLWTLTGWIPEEIHLNEAIPDELWNRVYKGFRHGDVLITLGTGKMSSKRDLSLGLESYHSYVVLRMSEEGKTEKEKNRLFLLKNPWLDGKGWCGPRPEGAPAEEVLSVEEPYHPQAATFWMDLGQVIRCFETLYLNWNPGLFRYRQDIHFDWVIDARHKKSGGCVIDHPQFSFSSGGAGDVWFLLNRHICDIGEASESTSVDHSSKGYMSLCIWEGNGGRVYHKEKPAEQAAYVSTPQCLLRLSTGCPRTYTVLVDQEEFADSTYSFTLSAFSTSAISLEQATEQYSFHKVEDGAWTGHTAGGATQSPSYFKNPQYALEIRKPTSLTVLLTSSREYPLNVKLVRGYGKRVYQLKSRDILGDSGDYRSGSALAKAYLEPGTYTIICSLFEAGRTCDFTLRVDSTCDVGLTWIPRDGAGLLKIQTPRVCFAPKVRRLVTPLTPNRLASVTVVSHFLNFASPVASHEQLRTQPRSLLRVSIELGRGPDRKRLTASEGGEFSDSMMLRTETIDIEPRIMAYGQQPWVVIERLSTPGGPIEEFYGVEILTNMPSAFDYGQWREWDE